MSLRLRTATPVVAVGLTLALTGCGANFEAQTYQDKAPADSTNAGVGAIAVRNVNLVAPESGEMYEAGDDADVQLTLTNDGTDDDRLVEVSSPAAGSVEILGQAGADGVDLPGRSTTENELSLQLADLGEDLRPGRYVELTLRFERGGDLTVSVPVATTGEYEEREHSDNFHQIGEEH